MKAYSPTSRVLLGATALLTLAAAPARGIDPSERTADLPDSWLVIYNGNSAASFLWAEYFQQQRGIPSSHLIGLGDLGVFPPEHLDTAAEAQALIITPIRELLANDPQLEQSVMGIVLGFGVPGHFGNPPQNPSTGGFSIADALQDMTDDGLSPAQQKNDNSDNPHFLGNTLPPGGRLTKATMAANRYMVARIDAPTLEEAKALTDKAIALQAANVTLFGQSVWYDYYDATFPAASDEWFWLRFAVELPDLTDLPWQEFDLAKAEPDLTPGDAFRFSIYKLWGWSTGDFQNAAPGSRVLAFHLNSFGAVTVRSTTDSGGLYVPNALAAGYAAAIGATGEPGSVVGPFPDTLLAALGQGWTLGEAYYLANPFNDWMWTLIGDPFLQIPNWFDDIAPLPGDVNFDGQINLRDLAGFRACLNGPAGDSVTVCQPFDMVADGHYDLKDFAEFQIAFTGGPVQPATGDVNGDGFLDLVDFTNYDACNSPPQPTAVGSTCGELDFDFDLDVDLKDFSGLQKAFNQPVPSRLPTMRPSLD